MTLLAVSGRRNSGQPKEKGINNITNRLLFGCLFREKYLTSFEDGNGL